MSNPSCEQTEAVTATAQPLVYLLPNVVFVPTLKLVFLFEAVVAITPARSTTTTRLRSAAQRSPASHRRRSRRRSLGWSSNSRPYRRRFLLRRRGSD
ncbi:hypothetical protein NP493_1442g00068 [Ridgeia piscesae]|uniref:Uncharacterized protein n=1 Tax=Ridgeia piscesae TaxID=27915 RepID=A0AAD9K2V1_RIDPI|nr:hypothetical protein NP493_1442g00068 [Ridgeia piscesae]